MIGAVFALREILGRFVLRNYLNRCYFVMEFVIYVSVYRTLLICILTPDSRF